LQTVIIFVDKGTALCNILALNDLKIQANVPVEYNGFAEIGHNCKVVLPNNTEIKHMKKQKYYHCNLMITIYLVSEGDYGLYDTVSVEIKNNMKK